MDAKQRLALGYWYEKERNKDDWLADRNEWEQLYHIFGNHDIELHDPHYDVKAVIRNLDKAGALTCSTVEEAEHKLEDRRQNQKVYGHPKGADGIVDALSRWSDKHTSERNRKSDAYLAYIGNLDGPVWKTRRERYLRDNCWDEVGGVYRCEVCGADHESMSTMDVHHTSYDSMDGNEPDWHLLGVCPDPCHLMADVAYRLQRGRFDEETLAIMNDAMRPLFRSLVR